MIDFKEVEDALWDWVSNVTGLPDDQILYAEQNGSAPKDGPFITLRVGDMVKIGRDAVMSDYDAARPAGKEIRNRTAGMRYLTITVQVFTPDVPITDVTPFISGTVGSATARTWAAKLEASLALDTYRDALNAVGLGVLQTGDVRWVPAIEDAAFEGRALLEVLFAVPQGFEEFTGYIAHVVMTGRIAGVDKVSQVDLEGSDPYDDHYHRDI